MPISSQFAHSFARPNERRIWPNVINFEYFPRSYSLLCDVIYSQVSRVDTPIESHAHFIKCLCVLPVRACLRPHYIVLFTPGTPRYTDLCTSVLAPRRESLADDFATKPRSEPPGLSSKSHRRARVGLEVFVSSLIPGVPILGFSPRRSAEAGWYLTLFTLPGTGHEQKAFDTNHGSRPASRAND